MGSEFVMSTRERLHEAGESLAALRFDVQTFDESSWLVVHHDEEMAQKVKSVVAQVDPAAAPVRAGSYATRRGRARRGPGPQDSSATGDGSMAGLTAMTVPYMSAVENVGTRTAGRRAMTVEDGAEPIVRRHAYIPGALNTLCGVRLSQMAYFVPGRDTWDSGGPTRCERCVRLASG
jgi:hypothetical protein